MKYTRETRCVESLTDLKRAVLQSPWRLARILSAGLRSLSNTVPQLWQ
ncbi:hypothetical protein [Argonema galeatum]|nr:hypothetical protein [Argonema galeatum]MCL1467161.1 hypothetical protein [Argonema galeatum A003/A1]